MATHLLPLLVLLLSSHISGLSSAAGNLIPSSVTQKAAAIQYWNSKVHNNEPLPTIFLSKLATINLQEPFTVNLETTRADNSKHIQKNTARKAVLEGFFFKESCLEEGNVMHFVNFEEMLPDLKFLPRSVAKRIPFSAEAIRNIFHISPNSLVGKSVDRTIAYCNEATPTTLAEEKRCIVSAEDMIDHVISVLGSENKIEAWSTDSTSGCGGEILIGKVKVASDHLRQVSCHQGKFPYLLYYCRSVTKTRVYDVEILDVETKKKINQGTVTCHMDTSDWPADHDALKMVDSAPGETEVCHWMSPWSMAWIPTATTTATA